MKQPLQETGSLLFRNEQALTTHGSITGGGGGAAKYKGSFSLHFMQSFNIP